LFTAASSSFSNPIIRSGEDCRHFNFNSYSGIADNFLIGGTKGTPQSWQARLTSY
jgi:hypothetical protein